METSRIFRETFGKPSGELTVCYGKSPFLMGKSTISMAIFNCYVSSPEGKNKGDAGFLFGGREMGNDGNIWVKLMELGEKT